VRIFAGVPRGGGVKRSGLVEERNFRRYVVTVYIFGNFRQDVQDIILRRLFSDPQFHDLE